MKITVRAELDFDSIDYLCLDDFDGNKYIEGIGFKANNTLIVLENGDEFPIKPNTRSINLDDMLDSQGNKIFASLSEDGKGGDIFYDDDFEMAYIVAWNNSLIIIAIDKAHLDSTVFNSLYEWHKTNENTSFYDLKVIGIQE